MTKVFIDGSAGTTGLRIRERLSQRSDISLITLPEEVRKDAEARREALNAAIEKESEKLSTLLSAFEADSLSDIQPQDMNDEEILPDPVIYDTIRFLVRELEAEGKATCPCGRGSYDFRFTDDGIQVVCPDCGASYEFIATSPEAANGYLTLDEIRLK